MAIEAGIVPVIPPKSNRKERRKYDEYLYRIRHLVENAFMELYHFLLLLQKTVARYATNKRNCEIICCIRIRIWYYKRVNT